MRNVRKNRKRKKYKKTKQNKKMRIIKTKEEIALTQRAYRYFDKIHSFGYW